MGKAGSHSEIEYNINITVVVLSTEKVEDTWCLQ